MNLLKEAKNFAFWSPTNAQTPNHCCDFDILSAECKSSLFCFGKWVGSALVKPGLAYAASVQCHTETPDSVYAMANWLDENGKYIRREYLIIEPQTKGQEWVRLSAVFVAPQGAAKAEIELTLHAPGAVKWQNVTLAEAPPIAPRPVRIASAFFAPRRNLQRNLEAMLELADKAGEKQADVLLFTESAYDRGVTPIEAKCVPIPSISSDDVLGQFAAKAKQHNCNIIVNLTEDEGGFFFNTTVLLDRNGKYVGKYRKSHLPPVEKEAGYSPGDDLPVFAMDFATIGILTCFDLAFLDTGRTLKSKGAELIFVPTIGNFMLYSQVQAKENGMYVIVSGGDLPHPSRILDPNGDIIASVDGACDGIAFAEIEVSRGFYSMATGFYPATSNAGNALFNQRRKKLYKKPENLL